MKQAKAVKLKDLALELDLAVSTVSRAMSGKGRVSSKTRERVLQAVRQTHYTPNGLARSLRTKDTKNIGIIVTDITNSFFATVIKGAQGISREQGYSILLSNTDENSQYEKEALQLMLEKQISGLILASVGGSAERFGQYKRMGVPIVFIDNIPQFQGTYDSVSTDNKAAAYSLTRQVIQRGHRELGMITGPLNQSSGLQRYEGFCQAMQEAGIPIKKDWVREGDFRMESGHACMRQILGLPSLPSALLVANNYMAFGAIGAIKAAGKSVPQDMAVASFDVEDITGLSNPHIVSMNQAAEEIGRRAAEVLIHRINNDMLDHNRQIVLDPVFMDGNSW